MRDIRDPMNDPEDADDVAWEPKTVEQIDADDAETDRLFYESGPEFSYYGEWRDGPDFDEEC